MSSRHNFLDADNSIMERNLRFVTNDLEDNLNQYFGGSGSRGHNPAISAPPRDYKVVQPKPENILLLNCNNEDSSHVFHSALALEQRRQFLIKIGLARHEAYDLAKGKNFDVNYYREKRHEWLKNGIREKQVDDRLLFEIKRSNYKSVGDGDRHEDHSDRRDNEIVQQQYFRKFNETVYGGYDSNIEASSSSFDREQDYRQNYDRSQRDVDLPPPPPRKIQWDYESEINMMRYDGRDQRTHSRSPPRDEHREERTFTSYQSSRSSRSPPSGFNSMSQQERMSALLFDDFPSTSHSNSVLLETMPDRGEVSRNFINFIEPSSDMKSYELSTSNTNLSSHGFLNNSENALNLQRTQMGYGNQHPNDSPLMRENTKNRGPNEREQNFGNQNPINEQRNFTNIPLIIDDTLIPPVQNRQPFSTAFFKHRPLTPPLTTKAQRNLLKRKEILKLQKRKKRDKRLKNLQQRLNDPYKKPVTYHPIIQCGFKDPPPGLSKAKPQEYWSQWWARYKYIEKSIPHINPQHTSVIILVEPEDSSFRKSLLLRIGINKILRNIDLTEKNYAFRDTFKLFKYKKHLENPKFHKFLASSEMNRVRSTLRRLEDKKVLALFHQSLIARWHMSLDVVKRAKAGEMIKSKNAYNLLSDPAFQYLVMESIKQLKEICKQDWSGFEVFYNSLYETHEVIDLTTLGFCFKNDSNKNMGGNGGAENNNDEAGDNEDDDDEDDEDDDDDDGDGEEGNADRDDYEDCQE